MSKVYVYGPVRQRRRCSLCSDISWFETFSGTLPTFLYASLYSCKIGDRSYASTVFTCLSTPFPCF